MPTANGADLFNVVANHEEQFSIWPVDKEMPRGWRKVAGTESGTKEACLSAIQEIWTDMRPASLRG